MLRRLSRQIYLTILGSLLLVVLVSGLVWRFGGPGPPQSEPLEMAGELVAAALPADEPLLMQQETLRRLARRLGSDLALFDQDLRPVVSAGQPLPPPVGRAAGGWIRGSRPPAFSILLPDDRWLVMRPRGGRRNPILNLVLFLGAVALAVGVAAYPVVRRLTRRLERLQAGVETLGAGKLSTRVKVEGKDEVARLAASFNRAASQIEELMGAHRLLLANASHELRTPLSRIRLGIELLGKDPKPETKAALARDIAELDGIIDEILLASRLEAQQGLDSVEEVDLLALLAEECARYDEASLDGVPATVPGDRRLLTRLVRNLLENARRHGKPPVEVSLRREGAEAVLDVVDQGEGIPEAEREAVFAPFRRLKRRGEENGAGLGLSLVRQIATLHGGSAAVAAVPSGTTCFRVRLPAV